MKERIIKWLIKMGYLKEVHQYRHCVKCGSQLSEWFAESTMRCLICGTWSEYRWHPKETKIVPFWKVDYLADL